MFNPLNRARSPNDYPPNQINQNHQYNGNPYPITGQQSPINQPQKSYPYQQYPQNTPPKGYQVQQPYKSNPPFEQQPLYPTSQQSVQSIQLPPQSQPPQQVTQLNYAQIPQNSQKQLTPQSIETQKLQFLQNNLQQQGQSYAPSLSSVLSFSGLRQSYIPPTFVPLQPIMTTVIQRPIEFVDLDKFEEVWNKRMNELEDRIRQSQQQPESQVVELRGSNDEDKDDLIKQLQEELYKVRCDNEEKDRTISNMKIDFQLNIQTLNTQIKKLNNDNNDLRQELEALRQQKQFFKEQCDNKDEHIQNLEREIEELRQHLESLTEEVTTSQSVKTYEEEAKVWKTRFKELNDTYHACQEKLILTEAELELLRRPQSQQRIVTTSKTVVKNNIQRSGTKSDSDNLSSSLTSQDIERIQNLQKHIPQI